jgi:hypothetical protein
MAQFVSGTPATFTPVASTTDANAAVLSALTVGQMAQVTMINWGGDGTSLVGYITRWARITNTAATPTARLISNTASPTVTPQCSCNTYATPATATADTFLFKQNWQIQGGGGAVVMPIRGEWRICGGALGTLFNQIGIGNIAGADANLSNYAMTWEE